MTDALLPEIPVADLRSEGVVRHARASLVRVRALRDECLAFFPRPLHPLLAVLDGVTRRWLVRSQSPYVAEIAAIADALDFSGAWFLNGSYQWGCTTLACGESGPPLIARTLDWPFPGLGRSVEIVRMAGDAGEYSSVTWPGFVGVLTALAPGRFAAAINQAPMWRRTLRPWLRPYDFAVNAVRTWSLRYMPPDHLLRHVFETCADYAEARAKLETMPVARPVIFTLAGCAPGEYCVIERTETGFATRTDDTSVANDWQASRAGWEARAAGAALLSRSFEEAAEDSRLRRTTLAAWGGDFRAGPFGWVAPPVLNPFTRLAVVMCPAEGLLRVCGYEAAATAGALPRPATAIREMIPAHAPLP